MHYIYCLTNRQNGKQYIGRTNNVQNRQNQHKNDSFNINCPRKYNTALAGAIRKYGWDNFDMKILDKNEDFHIINELEKKYIKELNTKPPQGYNLSDGGEFGFSGREYHSKVIESGMFDNIIEDLQLDIPMKEIAKHYNISYSYLSEINNGTKLKQEDISYPIRARNDFDSIFSLYPIIIEELKVSNKSMRQISRDYGVSQEVVRKINNGQTKRAHLFETNFPIRK